MPDLQLQTLTVVTQSEAQTEALGEKLGRIIEPGCTVLLSGDLGAGKTCMARGIARGAECTVGARSPTFIIVAEYPGRVRIFHCDLYRVTSDIEIDELALHENLERGAVVVEWPENGGSSLPNDALTIRLDAEEDVNSRHLRISAQGRQSNHLFARLMESLQEEPPS